MQHRRKIPRHSAEGTPQPHQRLQLAPVARMHHPLRPNRQQRRARGHPRQHPDMRNQRAFYPQTHSRHKHIYPNSLPPRIENRTSLRPLVSAQCPVLSARFSEPRPLSAVRYTLLPHHRGLFPALSRPSTCDFHHRQESEAPTRARNHPVHIVLCHLRSCPACRPRTTNCSARARPRTHPLRRENLHRQRRHGRLLPPGL